MKALWRAEEIDEQEMGDYIDMQMVYPRCSANVEPGKGGCAGRFAVGRLQVGTSG